MFRVLGRPLLARAPHTVARANPICRAISSTPRLLSDKPPSIFGPGSPAGAVPTDEAQATGLDRLQLLAKMEGYDVFNQKPLEMTRKGTLDEPIPIPSLAKSRIVGCTGFPSESHDVLWINLRRGRKGRCKECGNVFMLDFIGEEHDEEHNH